MSRFLRGLAAGVGEVAKKNMESIIDERRQASLLKLKEKFDIAAEGRAETRQIALEGRTDSRTVEAEGRAVKTEDKIYGRNRADKVADDAKDATDRERIVRLQSSLSKTSSQDELRGKIAVFKENGFTDEEIKQALSPRAATSPFKQVSATTTDAAGNKTTKIAGSFNESTGAYSAIPEPERTIEVDEKGAGWAAGGAKAAAPSSAKPGLIGRINPDFIGKNEALAADIFTGSTTSPSRASLESRLRTSKDPNEIYSIRQQLSGMR